MANSDEIKIRMSLDQENMLRGLKVSEGGIKDFGNRVRNGWSDTMKEMGSSVSGIGGAVEEVAGKHRHWNRIMRESVVIMREAGRGNFSRIPGSLSIIVQDLAEKFPLLAKGALGFVGVFGSVAAVAAVVAYHFVKIAKAAEEISATNLFSNKLEATANALKSAAVAAEEYSDWLDKLNNKQDSLAQSANRTIKQMERYASASGESKVDLYQDELDLFKDSLEKAKKLKDDARRDSDAKEKQSTDVNYKISTEAVKTALEQKRKLLEKEQTEFDSKYKTGALSLFKAHTAGSDYRQDLAKINAAKKDYEDTLREDSTRDAYTRRIENESKAAKSKLEEATNDVKTLEQQISETQDKLEDAGLTAQEELVKAQKKAADQALRDQKEAQRQGIEYEELIARKKLNQIAITAKENAGLYHTVSDLAQGPRGGWAYDVARQIQQRERLERQYTFQHGARNTDTNLYGYGSPSESYTSYRDFTKKLKDELEQSGYTDPQITMEKLNDNVKLISDKLAALVTPNGLRVDPSEG